MKRLLSALATAAAIGLSTPALAADDLDVLPPNYTTFVSVSFLYGFGALDRDYEASQTIERLTFDRLSGTFVPNRETRRVGGSFGIDRTIGAKIEAGAFVAERVRVSADLRFTRTNIESFARRDLDRSISTDIDVEGIQGFVNLAYEFPLSDITMLPLLQRTKVFGIAGIGAADATFKTRGEDSDTVVVGKVGVGSVFDITDNVALISETNFIFGRDFEFEFEGSFFPEVASTTDLENREIVYTIGLRFSF